MSTLKKKYQILYNIYSTGELELKAPPQSKLASTFGEDFKKNNIGGSNSRQFAKK